MSGIGRSVNGPRGWYDGSCRSVLRKEVAESGLADESTTRGDDRREGNGMGRIVVQTRVTNLFDEDKSIECGMFADTGAGALILPAAWKERLGRFKRSEAVELQMANREVVRGEACWPVEVKIEGFRPVSNEVIFVDMKPEENAEYEPLLGYVILEQAQAALTCSSTVWSR